MRRLSSLWARQDSEWRDTSQIASQWEEARSVAPSLLRFRVWGSFWEILDRCRATLLVTREYEHLAVAFTISEGRPRASFLRIPHPSGLVYDPARRMVHLASTRNPNQILELRPLAGHLSRSDVKPQVPDGRPLVPVTSRFYPGCTYLHELALVGGELHANAVGENAVVRVDPEGALSRVWWPKCIEARGRPIFDRNHIQLNSIAAGSSLEESFFSASTDEIGSRRPGHRNFPVDGRGVVFSGKTREPITRGLTRPHSARLHRERLWVLNSGYGEIGIVEDSRFRTVRTLPGWTRGLAFQGRIAFAGTSRVLPRFTRYAPGLNLEKSVCGVHALDTRTGEVLGSLVWPEGNQIFTVELAPREVISGFPFNPRRRGDSRASKRLFYTFRVTRKVSS